MSCPEYTNCYCFNAYCKASIFNALTFSGIKTPVAKLLSEETLCPVCGEPYVSKYVLELKIFVHETLHTTIAETTV